MVPVVLGFEPSESVVLLTFPAPRRSGRRRAAGEAAGGAEPRFFHARVDLPHDDEEAAAVTAVLRDPVVQHGVDRLALVLLTADAERARAVGRRLADAFADREVLAVLHADGRRWWALGPDGEPHRPEGTAYDVSAHPFRAEAVVRGTVVAPNREAVVELVAPDPSGAARVGWHARALVGPLPDEGLRRAGEVLGVDDVEDCRSWVVALVLRTAHGGGPGAPTDAEVARVALVLHDARVREAAWWLLTDPGVEAGQRRLDAWCALLRRTPAPLAPPVAVLTAAAACLAGQGALAWAALDRCLAVDPDFPMADAVQSVLQRAVPPEELRASLVSCFGQVVPGAAAG